MVDWTGGVIKDDDSATDVKFIDLSTVHYLSGPVRVLDRDGIPAKPGVRFPGLTHPGIIGTAPSMELLNIWNEREREVEENGHKSLKLCEVLHSRPLANLPSTKGCHLEKLGLFQEEKMEEIVTSKTLLDLPVFVEGANLSTGDMHFFSRYEIIRGGMKEYLTPMGPPPLQVNPIFEIGPVEPRFSEWLLFEGISVDESGRQHFLDAGVAYKHAVLNAIDYLSKYGGNYGNQQIYLLLSCCPCEGRISGIVDSPNAVATLAIPTAIFDQDIRPKTGKVPVGPRLVRTSMHLQWKSSHNKEPSCLDIN
ncbi:hypothetical protein REPUB_Repub10bG0132600 [Reevesia pubescens]